MRNRSAALIAIMGVVPWLGWGELHAQQVASHRCAAVVDSTARLACYDAEYPPSAEVVAATADRQVREFGQNGQRRTKAEEGPDRLEARVTSLAYRSDGARTVDLDSGQQWLITEPASRGHFSQGDRVILRKAALGSYMLVTPAGVALRARRIR